MEIGILRILVVEDEIFQRHMIFRILKAIGVKHLFEATDGHTALEMIRKLPSEIDIIISDLNMPGMDGMEFLRHLSEQKSNASIILSSGLERNIITSIEAMAMSYGISILGVIEKPITKMKLESLLNRYLLIASNKKKKIIKQKQTRFPKKALIQGLKNDEFELFFQPKVEMRTRLLKGAEALVRWRHPELGIVAPDRFIPEMERLGLIDDLTWIILKKAADHCKAWRQAGLNITVSVNLSLMTLIDITLADRINGMLIQEGLDTSHVIIEITESTTTSYIGSVLENLSRLRMKGFGLSIDDYGTGYSTMQQLTRIAYTELKIDKSFVKNGASNEFTRVILSTSLEMAKKLRITSVAEGLETIEDWRYLLTLNCDQAQGYFIAKPMMAEAFYDWAIEWIRKQKLRAGGAD